MRRATIGGALVEGEDKYCVFLDGVLMTVLAMIEYSLDLDLPDVVFESPIIKAMSDATTDLMTWPNVCPSLSCFLACAHMLFRTFVLST